MKQLAFIAMALALTLSSYAFADHKQDHSKDGIQQGAQKNEVPVATLRFEDVKEACLNPARFHNQVAPSNIQIQCRDVQYKWMPDAAGAMNIGTSRQITSSLLSDKYMVGSQSAPLTTPAQSVACPRFKMVEQVVETARAVTCAELVAFKGNAIEFCTATINNLVAANGKAVSSKETGRVVDMCNQAQQKDRQKMEVE
jgi:hypothetical protein